MLLMTLPFILFYWLGYSQRYTRDLKFILSLLTDPVQGFKLILEEVALNYFTLYDILKILVRERGREWLCGCESGCSSVNVD